MSFNAKNQDAGGDGPSARERAFERERAKVQKRDAAYQDPEAYGASPVAPALVRAS